MFDLLFIVSIIGGCMQGIKEACTPAEPILINTENHPEPHRNPNTGKIIIENCEAYYKDVEIFGAWQAQQWVKQGKYNL